MSHIILFVSDEIKDYIISNLHEPLRKMVWKTGWRINVSHGFMNDDKVQVMISTAGYKNRNFIIGSVNDLGLVLEESITKLHELGITPH
jgi:hypothetical protein